jgi:hypothetical protein
MNTKSGLPGSDFSCITQPFVPAPTIDARNLRSVDLLSRDRTARMIFDRVLVDTVSIVTKV